MSVRRRPTVSVEDVRRLPPLLSVRQLAPILGLGHASIYAQIAEDRFPLEVLRIGGELRSRRTDVLELLKDPGLPAVAGTRTGTGARSAAAGRGLHT